MMHELEQTTLVKNTGSWIKIRGGKHCTDITVEFCYRLPSQIEGLDDTLINQLSKHSGKTDIVLMGDFNYLDIFWRFNTAKNIRFNESFTCIAANLSFQKMEAAARRWGDPEGTITDNSYEKDKMDSSKENRMST